MKNSAGVALGEGKRWGRVMILPRISNNCLLLLICLFSLLLSACFEPEIPGGEITIRNDILDKEYNTFVVDQVESETGGASYSVKIKPQQEVVLPYKGISSLRFTRRYQDHSKIYVVNCPKGFNKQIKIKLIDVHTNRIPGGCKLIKKGIKDDTGYVKWQ